MNLVTAVIAAPAEKCHHASGTALRDKVISLPSWRESIRIYAPLN